MKNKPIKILAIETSCDETAAAIISEENGSPVIVSNIISSQVDLHAKTGGVVPEVASRAHMEAIIPVVTEALLSTDRNSDLKAQSSNIQEAIRLLDNITHIAVTAGPGLIGSLLVGFNAAKSLSYSKDLPIIPINHIEGHIYSAFSQLNEIKFPILALTVSGGHTSITLMKDHGIYESIGDTLDDAVGEAYDKVGKLLGLGYPGGPAVSKLAGHFRMKNVASKNKKVTFPRPIINDGTFNFSFSGLKTAVLLEVKRNIANLGISKSDDLPSSVKAEIAFAFEEAVADVLVAKTAKAIQKFGCKTVIFAGGVSANGYLKTRLKEATAKCSSNIDFLVPPSDLTGDNAAMIGIAAFYHIQRGDIKMWNEIRVDSNWELV